ncbi:hypothetical protein QQZ08_003751 [Neonectria magnoliae]|uniref:Uncharacterized protein n=1 Tax=Neonectria magnoliae TaxID=2732573 RepID=A0ABR1I9P4_9HYPO
MAATVPGEASRAIEFTTIEKLFDEIDCTIGDMLLVHGEIGTKEKVPVPSLFCCHRDPQYQYPK